MECQLCERTFSSKHSLATHKSRYHRSDPKSDFANNQGLIKLMMKAVLDGEIVLTPKEKKQLLPARDSIRKIVYDEANLTDVYDETLESAIKLIVKFTKKKFPSLVFNNPTKSLLSTTKSQDSFENVTDQEYDSDTSTSSSPKHVVCCHSDASESGDEQESDNDS